jgi:hypothetical protein
MENIITTALTHLPAPVLDEVFLHFNEKEKQIPMLIQKSIHQGITEKFTSFSPELLGVLMAKFEIQDPNTLVKRIIELG